MAIKNVKINVKTDTGYDTLYPKTQAEIIDFDKTSSNLTSANVDAAIKEVNTKADSAKSTANTNKTNIGTLTSLTTDFKTNLVGAINEVDSHANSAQSTANTNKTSIGTLSSLLTSAKTNLVSAINEIVNNYVKKSSIINNLTSTSTTNPLSANMGKQLGDKLNGIDNRVDVLETTVSEDTTATSYQGIFKHPSGILILFGSAITSSFVDDSNVGIKTAIIKFRESFKNTPVVVASPSYPQGIPSKTGVIHRTTTEVKLGCSSATSNLYVQWVAFGRWK